MGIEQGPVAGWRALGARPRVLAIAGILALAATVGVAFFLDLGRAYLWDPGEGRYAEAVREMLITRNWIVPTLNFAHYYDKPPGFYWLVAGAFRAFGTSEWAARLPAAVAAVLTIALTVGFAWRRLGAAAALGAGAILATAIEFVILGRSVRMDMLLTLCVTATVLYAFVLWEAAEEEGAAPRATWPLYVVPAAGVLIKGPVAIVLPVLVIGLLAALTGEYRRLRVFRPGPGALVGLALAGSWYVAAALYDPVYLWAFLWRHNVGRFVGAGEGHLEPFWYFLWILPLSFLPWSLFLAQAIRHDVRRARQGDELSLLTLLWAGVVVVFFTISRAKLATYVLPAFPPLALLVARYLATAMRAAEPGRARTFRIPAAVWAAGMVVLGVGIVTGVAVRYPSYVVPAAATLALLAFPLAGVVAMRRNQWQLVPLLMFVAALATQALFYRVGSPIVNEFSSLRSAAEAARDLPTEATVFNYKTRGHSFVFYGGRAMTRVRSQEAAAAALRGPGPAALLTKTKYLDSIQQQLAEPVAIWWQGPSGRVLLANRPVALQHASAATAGRTVEPVVVPDADGKAPPPS